MGAITIIVAELGPDNQPVPNAEPPTVVVSFGLAEVTAALSSQGRKVFNEPGTDKVIVCVGAGQATRKMLADIACSLYGGRQ